MKSRHRPAAGPGNEAFRARLHEIIFESDTREGRLFDTLLLVMIVTSVLVVTVESIPAVQAQHLELFFIIEWVFTVLFTAEYLLRIYSVKNARAYVLSFYGIIDLLSILPTYLTLFLAGSQYLAVIRVLRLMRIFRIFKLSQLIRGQAIIVQALKASRPKILVFLVSLLLIVTVIGAVMYVVEGPYNPKFSSIPQGIYWAIVTLTTVGFGDITPVTDLGKFLSAIVMILGYSIIAVPTGIISAEMVRPSVRTNSQVCSNCGFDEHPDEAEYCMKCGHVLR